MNQNREPGPALEASPISPFISATSSRQIARPSPAPPYRRVEEPSACSNRWKILGRAPSGTPTPVPEVLVRPGGEVGVPVPFPGPDPSRHEGTVQALQPDPQIALGARELQVAHAQPQRLEFLDQLFPRLLDLLHCRPLAAPPGPPT